MEHQERIRPANSEGFEEALLSSWAEEWRGDAWVRTVKSMEMRMTVLGEGIAEGGEFGRRVMVRLEEDFSPEKEKFEDQTELLRTSRGGLGEFDRYFVGFPTDFEPFFPSLGESDISLALPMGDIPTRTSLESSFCRPWFPES